MEQKDRFIVLVDNDNVLVEQDNELKRKNIYNKVNGKIDNEKYLENHKDDFLQPIGSTEKEFAKRYPKQYELFKRNLKINKQRYAV